MTEPEQRIGSLVDGRYKLIEVVASGAMGAVYKAERVPIGKLVAIKFLHASFKSDSEFQTRFIRETRVMSKLNHPNCVSVLDFGTHEDTPYLVMDFVDGKTLRDRLDEGPLSPGQALDYARQVLAGLAHAHAQDVFHRDVKPANIMISEEIGHGDRVRILDFGLARLRGNVGRDATQSNVVVGTPNYMAPEQTLPGMTIDARTDLYAVGVVLYEMIVGERPFGCEDTLQLLGMHRGAPIPRLVEHVRPGTTLPVGVQAVIDTAMAKSPGDRYQTAIEFAHAIDEVVAGRLDHLEVDATLPKLKTGPIVVDARTSETGSTVLAVDSGDARGTLPRRRRTAPLVALLLASAGLASAGYLMVRRGDGRPAPSVSAGDAPAALSAGERSADTDTDRDSVARGDAGTGSGVTVAAAPPLADAAGGPRADASSLPPDAAGGPLPDAGGPSSDGADLQESEAQIDPAVAPDPDAPNKGSAAPPEDEEADAPRSEEEVERREAPVAAPQLARTVHDAVVMIQRGQASLALTSLRRLWKQQPASAYIPFLLGNLYFDRRWWSVSLEHYRAAIKKNPDYRKNPVLSRNVIRMLASGKTRQAATNFIRGVLGSHARAHLRWAAANEQNAVVRKQAASLVGFIR